MKTLFKLIVVAAIIHAIARAGLMAADYYRLKDDALQLITFGTQVLPSQIEQQILSRGWELDLPLVEQNVSVRREGVRTTVTASYTGQYEYFPNNFYPVELSFQVEAYSLNPGVQDK